MSNTIKQYRVCGACRALKYNPPLYSCSIGFQINECTGRPLEPCPKPTSNRDLCMSPHGHAHVPNRR